MSNDDLAPALSLVISEAATWCFNQPFRSPALDPSTILDVPDWSHDSEPFEPWVEKKYESYRRAVLWINETRSKLLKEKPKLDAAEVLSECRLLTYWPLETVDDGASEAGSMGFYDLHDAPPWDTWFYMRTMQFSAAFPSSQSLVHRTGLMEIRSLASNGQIGRGWLARKSSFRIPGDTPRMAEIRPLRHERERE